eukprot:892126-Rhodomonas_salina.1
MSGTGVASGSRPQYHGDDDTLWYGMSGTEVGYPRHSLVRDERGTEVAYGAVDALTDGTYHDVTTLLGAD